MADLQEIRKYKRFFRDPRVGDNVLAPPASGVACSNIRTALRMLGYDNEYGDVYDDEVARSVLRFQADLGHASRDGHFGPGTRRLLTERLLEQFGPPIFGRLSDPQPGYIFVSYKRDDLARVVPHLDRLEEWGYEVWFDQGIPGGVEFYEAIERKVAGCELLLAFLSQAAAEAKWIRRELEFADAQDKPIVATLLEDLELGGGLNLLLSQYQMIDARDANFGDKLRAAIEHVWSR